MEEMGMSKEGSITECIKHLRYSRDVEHKKGVFKELLTLTTAEELGEQYNQVDFNVFYGVTQLTLEEQVAIINGGFYREYSNLIGVSTQRTRQKVDVCQLQKGLCRYLDEKMIPWIELDTEHKDALTYSFYTGVLEELGNLNGLYLKGDEEVQTYLDTAQGLLVELKRKAIS